MKITGRRVLLRGIEPGDLKQIAHFPFTLSIVEPLDSVDRLSAVLAETAFWTDLTGAVAVIDAATGRLVGTAQFYRCAPCIHGLELGYIIHDAGDRGRGYGGEALGLLVDHLFSVRPKVHRLQLVIEAWNVASWRMAERRAFVREGLLRASGFDAGCPADCFIYSRTRSDWNGARDASISLGGSGVLHGDRC